MIKASCIERNDTGLRNQEAKILIADLKMKK